MSRLAQDHSSEISYELKDQDERDKDDMVSIASSDDNSETEERKEIDLQDLDEGEERLSNLTTDEAPPVSQTTIQSSKEPKKTLKAKLSTYLERDEDCASNLQDEAMSKKNKKLKEDPLVKRSKKDRCILY